MASKRHHTVSFHLPDDLVTQIEAVSEQFRREQEKLQALLAPTLKQMEPIIRELNEHERRYRAQWDAFQRQFEPIIQALQRLPDTTKTDARILAKHGWFMDPEMAPRAANELAEGFSTGAEADAHAALCSYFETRLERAEENLCEKYPSRARLIRSAFAAHRRGDFAASIPLLLAQSDGICREATGVQLYSRYKLEPLTEGVRPFALALLVALVEPTPMTLSEKDRVGLVGILNRHAVMHGESTDYDTALNSNRAISLLIYVQWAIGEVLKPILQKKALAKTPR